MKKIIVWLLTAATLLLSLASLSFAVAAEETAGEGSAGQTALTEVENATSIDLYLIAGQSNAQGTTKITDRDAAYELAPELENGFSNVIYAGKAGLTSSYEFDWVPVTLDLGKGAGYIGPEAGMAISLSEYYKDSGRIAGIIKYAHGGSRLAGNDVDGEVANRVSPSYAEANGWEYGTDSVTGGHYRKFLEVFREKVAILIAEGYTDINIKGLYWMQGEGDRQDAEEEYVTALSYLIHDLRADLSDIMKEIYSETDDGGTAEMSVFVGAISETYLLNLSNRQSLNQKIIRAQKTVVAQTENCYFIDNSQYKISEFDAVNKTAIPLGSDTGHWNQPDMLAIGQTVGEEMYLRNIEIPSDYESADDYPFLLVQNGQVINAGTSWSNVSKLARVALDETPGGTVTVLLRRDHTITGAPSTENRLCFMNGTLILNLGGHTLTTNNTFLGAALPASYTGNYSSTCYVKNGTVLLGKGAAFITQNSGGSEKSMSVIFENVTFGTLGTSDTMTRDQLFQSSSDSSAQAKLNLSLTLKDCTIDLTMLDFTTLSKAFKIFNFNRSGIKTSITISGGYIKANSFENITWANLKSGNDTLIFGKSEMSREYTKLTLPADYALPELGGTNSEGESVLFGGNGVADTDNGTITYSLWAPVGTSYGKIDAEYADPEAYPFALFVDGAFQEAHTNWVNAFNAAQTYLSENTGKTVNILMRCNQTTSSGITHLGRVMGNIVLDLGTYTLTRKNHSVIEVATNGMTEEESRVNASITVKNGTLLASGRLLTFQVFNDFNKTMNVTFDSVTVKANSTTLNPVVATSYNAKNSGTGVITSTLTFKNCKFDFTEYAPESASYLFNISAGAAGHKVNILFDGGSIEGGIANLALANLGKNDSLSFINSGNGYTSYRDVTGTVDSSVAYNTDNGTMYFGMSAKSTVDGVTIRSYELGYKIKDYGIAPYSVYSDPDTHLFIIFRNGYYTATYSSWSAVNAAAIDLCTNEGDTVVMLLRKDFLNTAGAAKNPGAVKGTVILDLGGHTFSTTKTMFEAVARHTHDSTFKIVDGTIVSKRSGNGALIAFNRNSTDELGDGTYTGTANKNFYFIFENVRIELGDGTNTALTTIAWRTTSDATTETLNAYVTFNDCTFDLTTAQSTATELRLFHAQENGQTYIDVHFSVNGGQIIANDLSNVTVFWGSEDDSFTFGKGSDGAYTVLKTSDSENVPATPFDTAEGNGYFYASKTAGTYLLGIGRAKITGAAVNLGADLSVLYYVRIHDATLLSEGEFSMTFEMNGKTVTVTAYELVDGEYVFTLTGITPQRIADLIDATFTVNSEAIVSKNGYSVKQNCLNLLAKSAEQLGLSDEKYAAMQTLIADLLAYGQAAQDYKGYEGNGAILDGTENVVTSTVTPNEEDAMTLTGNVTEQLYFTSATVKFDNVNQLIVKLNASDADKTVVKINGTAYAPGDLVSLGNGIYKIETEGLAATDFDKAYEIELIYNGESVATLTYSVNAYAYAMNNGATENADMQTLALALYRYGVSAENYANAQ